MQYTSGFECEALIPWNAFSKLSSKNAICSKFAIDPHDCVARWEHYTNLHNF